MDEREALTALEALIDGPGPGGSSYGGYSYHRKAMVILSEALDERDALSVALTGANELHAEVRAERDRLITLCSEAISYVAPHVNDSGAAVRLFERLRAAID